MRPADSAYDMTTTHSRKVITFQHAYQPGQTTLCTRCLEKYEADPDSLDIPRLGPVQHGAHRGVCDVAVGRWADNPDDHTHSRKVITFQHAYQPGQTTLCTRCLEKYEADPDSLNIPRLGPCNHGLRWGICDVAAAEWDAEMRAGERAEVRS